MPNNRSLNLSNTTAIIVCRLAGNAVLQVGRDDSPMFALNFGIDGPIEAFLKAFMTTHTSRPDCVAADVPRALDEDIPFGRFDRALD